MRESARLRGERAAFVARIATGDESDVTDHITDLLLWAHGEGFDVQNILHMASVHFDAESASTYVEGLT